MDHGPGDDGGGAPGTVRLARALLLGVVAHLLAFGVVLVVRYDSGGLEALGRVVGAGMIVIGAVLLPLVLLAFRGGRRAHTALTVFVALVVACLAPAVPDLVDAIVRQWRSEYGVNSFTLFWDASTVAVSIALVTALVLVDLPRSRRHLRRLRAGSG